MSRSSGKTLPPLPPIPFSEPPYLAHLPSAYYTPSHLAWQRTCRAFISQHLTQHALTYERAAHVPPHVFSTFASAGFLLPTLSPPLPVSWIQRAGFSSLPGGLPIEKFDYLHFLIYTDEMARSGIAGPGASLTTGIAFGVPPIINYASDALKERVLPDLLAGRTRACIAITEPGAGSDVANIETTARRTADGRHFVVNGQKKWITNGIFADYATTAVRTGGPGPSGLSLLLIPLNAKGVTRRKIEVSGLATSGTTFIDFDDVAVPAGNLVGVEGAGMKYIMTNFNHERLTISIGAARQSRVAVAAAFEYVLKREAFGKPLIEQAVVRHRLAKVGAMVEAQWAWVEQLSYMMSRMPKRAADAELGGLTALVKASAGRVLSECAQCSALLFGGNGLTRTGQGEVVEKIYREVMGVRVPGGSEDVMLDLGIRELVKGFRRKIRELEKMAGSKL
ncbi:acyl-CoA dehydrogenase/oxidase, partial [Geopyxis carbonaria]